MIRLLNASMLPCRLQLPPNEGGKSKRHGFYETLSDARNDQVHGLGSAPKWRIRSPVINGSSADIVCFHTGHDESARQLRLVSGAQAFTNYPPYMTGKNRTGKSLLCSGEAPGRIKSSPPQAGGANTT